MSKKKKALVIIAVVIAIIVIYAVATTEGLSEAAREGYERGRRGE